MNYLVHSNIHSMIFLAIVNLLAITICFINGNRYSADSAIIVVSVIAGFLTFVIPGNLFRFVDNRKAVDTYFAIDVSRKDMLNTSLIFGSLIILVPYVVDIALITVLASVIEWVELSMPLILFTAMMCLAFVALLTFHSFSFLLANSVFDGVVMIFAYAFIPAILYGVVGSFLYNCIYSVETFDMDIFGRISLTFSTISTGLMMIQESHGAADVAWLLITSLACLVIGYYGCYRHFVKRRVERAESISNERLSYPFIILLYVVTLLMSTSFSSDGFSAYILYFLIFVCYIVATFVYRRKIRISLRDVITFALIIALAIGIRFACNATKGFGIPGSYDREPHNVYYRYYATQNEVPLFEEVMDRLDLEKLGINKADQISYVQIGADIMISEENYAETEKVRQILNTYRDRSINYYYDYVNDNGNDYYLYSVSGLHVYENPKYNFMHDGGFSIADCDRQYSYNYIDRGLSLSDLLEIDRVCPVDIYIEIYDNDGYYKQIDGYRLSEAIR